MEIGLEGRCAQLVTPSLSARALGSGAVDVYATPAMIALMEQTAAQSVAPHLEEGFCTVGTALNVSHEAATPMGMKVWCNSVLLQISGRKLTFRVEAFDEKGRIGAGTHERFIVRQQSFEARARAKLED